MTRSTRLFACSVTLSVALGCGGRADPEAERHREAVRAAEHDAAYAEGLAHLEAGAFDPAVAALEKAHALSPEDGDTANWLGRARAAKLGHDTNQYEKAMAAGRAAEAVGGHRTARAAVVEALRWRPNDADATAARDRAEIPALVEQGAEQFDAKRYADATRTFLAAAQRVPGDAIVRGWFQKAQDARRTEVRDEYEKVMGAGRAAASAGNSDAAVRWFTTAETLVPGDEAAAAEKVAAEFEGHVRRGRDARAANRPAEAVAEFEIAARLRPRDEAVKALLAAARQAQADADRERYKQAVAEAKAAMLARRYRDAVKLSQQAEGIVTDHTEATQLRRDAERVVAEYDQWISKAKSAIQRKRFDEAVAAADKAGRLMPGEAEPPVLRSEATRKKMDQAGKRK